MKKRTHTSWVIIAIVCLLFQSTVCCNSAAAQTAIEKRRPQGKADFSPTYQMVFDFLHEYAKSGSFYSLDDWSDMHTIAIAQHLVHMFPEKYPASKPGEPIEEEMARKYVYQFFTPIGDTRLSGICAHLWGEVVAWDYEANALFSLLTEPVLIENEHVIPLLPKAGDLQAEEAQAAAEKVMKERFGFTSSDLKSMNRFSYFAIVDTYSKTEPCWHFQYSQANGIYCNVDLSNKGKTLAFNISNYAPPMPEISRKFLNRTRNIQNASSDPIDTAKDAMIETGWLSTQESSLLGAVLYDLPLNEGAPMRNGWIVDLFLHGQLVGRAAITPEGALAEMIQPWERFSIRFESIVG